MPNRTINPVEIIRKKRDGEALTRSAIEAFLGAYVQGEVPDYQMSAFLMACYFSGMTDEETLALTDVMLRSGTTIDLSSIPGRKVDKHSTGGVGDKVSLILAPMVAACGIAVPMISGRGLGHTGGTLDKLAAIPGFRTDLSLDEYRRAVAATGLVLVGQTDDVVPADRKLYALRDVTATIESIPLIAGSIMSKKLAEGIDALVLDVKTGSGAFMPTYDQAAKLASTLVAIGNGLGKETVGFITAMDQPLGRNVGNWLEVREAVECLRGKQVPDLMEVTLVLAGTMVWLGGAAGSIEEGIRQCHSALWSGRAYEKFLACVRQQGGDPSALEHPERYPASVCSADIVSPSDGFVTGFDTRRIGVLAVELGAGRMTMEDRIDPKAGMTFHKKIGDAVKAGDRLITLFTDRKDVVHRVSEGLVSATRIGPAPPGPGQRIIAYVDRGGTRPWTPPPIV